MSLYSIRTLTVIALALFCFLSCHNQPSAHKEEGQDETSGLFDPSLSKKNKQQQKVRPSQRISVINTGLVAGGEAGQLLRRTAYTVSYNKNTRCANWVAWTLTKDHTSGPFKREGHQFHEDSDVPTPRATNNDYYRSGFNRGHLCPSGDNKWSEKTQSESFLFTNISPMHRELDGGDWNSLEQSCRHWANKYGKIYIVCGPIYSDDKEHRKLGKNKIFVPEQYFKVVMTYGKNGNSPKALGFIYDNKSGRHDMSYYVRTVDEIEEITGFNFFPFLADKLENRIEANANLRDWN